MNPHIVKEARTCRNPSCARVYEADIICLLNARIVTGDGYCRECVEKLLELEASKERVLKDREREEKRSKWVYESGIPPKFLGATFSNFDAKRKLETNLRRAFQACRDYAEGYPLAKPRGYRSLAIFSEHSWGVGKTHLVCAMARRIIERWDGEDIGCPVLFVSEPELYMRIQATYSFSSDGGAYRESEDGIIRELTRIGLLVIDDVGKRRVADPKFVQRIMFSVIDGRYKAMLPLVLTANLNPDRLAEYLGGGQGDEASFDRLVEMCGRAFWQIEGESYRARESKAGTRAEDS